jgi:hypothetical protein
VSRSTQDKVKEMFEAHAELYDLELIDDRDFANRGMWRVQSKAHLRDKVAIKYDFQPSYCSLKVMGVDPDNGPAVVGGGYIDSDDKLVDVVSRIRHHIYEHRR